MKVLFVGDVHNHLYMFKDIEELDQRYNFDEIIFFGDYVDDWNTTGKDSLLTLDKIFNLKMDNTAKYTLLLGNHELSYLAYPCAGYDFEFGELLKQKLLDNYNLLDLYKEIQLGDRTYVCSHAGLTTSYIHLELQNIDKDWRKALDMIKAEKQFKYLKLCSRLRGRSRFL